MGPGTSASPSGLTKGIHGRGLDSPPPSRTVLGGGDCQASAGLVPATMDHKKGTMRPVYSQDNGYPRLVTHHRGPHYEPLHSQEVMKPIGHIPRPGPTSLRRSTAFVCSPVDLHCEKISAPSCTMIHISTLLCMCAIFCILYSSVCNQYVQQGVQNVP